jgi:exopolysaccharide biosynthesis polyprenyl glycosylphosphotransferase
MARKRALNVPGAVLAALDFVLINLAFTLSWYARYELKLGREVAAPDYLSLDSYLGIQILLAVSLVVIYRVNGLYGRRRRQGWLDEVSGVTSGALLGIAVLIVAVFYLRPFGYSRLVFVYAAIAIIVLLSLARAGDRIWQGYLRRKGIGLSHVLVVGGGTLGRAIMQNLVAQPELGFHVIGFVDDERLPSLGRLAYLGRCADVSRLVRQYEVDEVIIALPSASHLEINEIVLACAKKNVSFRIVPDFFELSLNQVDVLEINGIPLIGLRDPALRGGSQVLKRLIDVAIATLGLVISSPLILALVVAIKLDSPGPILHRQVRIGRQGKPFKFYKFRSMRQDAERELSRLLKDNEADGPIFKMKNDPRRTVVGRFMRRFSFDELPQLVNVLRGDMSLIGPRPPIPHEVDQYQDWHRRRLEVAPGMTGLWQVSGRSELPFDEMALMDIWYIENWSLSLDLKILARTVPAVVFGYGAY